MIKVKSASLEVVGHVSPYSYQHMPKKDATKQISWNGGAPIDARFTFGKGKADATRYFVYFMLGERVEWIQLTPATFEALTKDKSKVLELVPEGVTKVEEPAPETPAGEEKAEKAEEAAAEVESTEPTEEKAAE